ncbi:universal stress protein [Desulfatitalea tepidiphila]|uniref:universal stress protein n=1 Tax=Desulfatitalea tepidiphila TaxID=1185843 RepID=UPI001F2F34B3|nr:universal stress protein [Desulfatitalea tepidiphila]
MKDSIVTERLLHVFQNTPLGRESLLQSLHFCKTLGVDLHIYVPESKQFLMYFDHDMVQVDLDRSYLLSPESAVDHARQLADLLDVHVTFLVPKNYTSAQLPDIPTHYTYMCCPQSISDLSAKIGLGYVGPKVWRIAKSSTFPVFMTGRVYKPWTSITVCYTGSNNANKALRWGLHLGRKSGMPVELFTFMERHKAAHFEEQLRQAGLWDELGDRVSTWHKIDRGSFEEAFYAVAHDTLLVLGAYSHGLIKVLLFGSKTEKIQAWMPNNMLLVGPHCAVEV